MTAWASHLIVAPVLLPLVVAALMLLLDERRRVTKNVLSLATTTALTVIAAVLLGSASAPTPAGTGSAGVYLVGNWPAPFGIVLVVDRLAALMLLLTSVLGMAALLFALARWSQAGPRFHSLLLLQLMGLNGAFLTGDLFNLFVFFEVLLAASYGLALHGTGRRRVRAGLHYIAINLSSSTLFLIGASLIYGVTGSLNMADVADRIASVPAADLGLLHAGVGILGVAFLTKAGMWPLSFWLPPMYSAASAPVAAVFALMTKVGVYVVLRLGSLFLDLGAGTAAAFGADWLWAGGIATLVFGTVGALSSRSLPRATSFLVLVSSGTLLAALGTGDARVVSASLYYLVSSTLALGAMFLIAELIDRRRAIDDHDAGTAVFADEYRGSLDDDFEAPEIGLVLPVTTALLGGAFAGFALVLVGLPPLSGFVAKFALLNGLIGIHTSISISAWVLSALLVASGLATLIALLRVGVAVFWLPTDRQPPTVRVFEAIPIAVLLALCVALTVGAGGAMRYADATTAWLSNPRAYIEAVLSAPRSPSTARTAEQP